MSEIKVLIVDDNAVLRMGLSHVIEIEDGYTVVGEASNAEEALVLYKRHEPDVVTMDYQMPGADGVACTQKITSGSIDCLGQRKNG